jgi:hypothetical protein
LKLLRPATEDEMVLAFLRAEIDSERYRQHYPHGGDVAEVAHRLIEHPDLNDPLENGMRRGLLRYRGYGLGQFLFAGLPDDLTWQRVELTLDELEQTKYADYPTWIELSGNTRRIGDGARNVGKLSPNEDPTEHVLGIAAALEQGRPFPELIFVSLPNGQPGDLILFEGHSRATAYAYAGKPDRLEALVGVSPNLARWRWFGAKSD